VALVRLSVPPLKMPPPSYPDAEFWLPSATVTSPTLSVTPAPTSKTRLAWLPLMVRFAAPGPLIVRSSVTVSWPLVRVIVPLTPNVMTSTVGAGSPAGQASTIALVFAASIASRSEQSPSPFSSSSVVVTTSAAACAGVAEITPESARRKTSEATCLGSVRGPTRTANLGIWSHPLALGC